MVKRKAEAQPVLEAEPSRADIGIEANIAGPEVRAVENATVHGSVELRAPVEDTNGGKATRVGHVVEEVLEQGPFWSLLMRAGYEVW